MKHITVTFRGQTNTRPSRYVASDSDGNKVIYSHHTSPAEHPNDHANNAARALCQKMDWHGKLVGNGQVYVWLREEGSNVLDV